MSHPLKIKEFRAYWIGQIISLCGTWMQHIAQSWLVYVLTKSAFYLGLISFLASFPTLLFTLFGGVVADRYPRRNILIATQTFSALPAVVVGVLIHLNLINIWHIAIASFVLGIATAFDMPARQAFITEIVYQDMITSAIAMQSISFNIARIVGPMLAGFIVTHLSFHMCFYLNALSFLPLIFILFSIKLNFSTTSNHVSFKESLKEGFQFILKNRQILYIICSVGVFTLFGLSFMTVLPIIAGEILKVEAKGFSMIVSSVGVGSLLSGIFIALKRDIKEKLNHIFRASLVFPIGLSGIAFSDNIYLTMLFAFLLGVAFVNFYTVSNSFIQHQTEQRLRGRVMSFFAFVFLGFTPIGNLLVGVLVEKFGVKAVLEIYSLICLAGGVLFLKILPSVKRRL
ncbi:predicted arabinose efflux permease, MFS family [Thermodesulfovibrio aggregans]|uniref:Predicted arabinose efflux permease, MFS family n=1 Tax=Thermodesulfovibrio aggregans TaxID=86166 RepID=A0A0U9I8A6_9BACT|nr:MFS transporter [Thermodesulfovibrio aggregans]GAQ93910.1 predicted arabinose efflux permease, MFS family [Thermodesulfovibrio aggregans]